MDSVGKFAIKKLIQNLESGLLTEIVNTQNMFSAGQLQLLCLARVILKKNKILILDEATARLDLETDKIIQLAIKKVFKECTVITIAHRISTIADYDKVVVMENGRVLEFDAPFLLLNKGGLNKNGYFANIVNSLNNEDKLQIFNKAKTIILWLNNKTTTSFYKIQKAIFKNNSKKT